MNRYLNLADSTGCDLPPPRAHPVNLHTLHARMRKLGVDWRRFRHRLPDEDRSWSPSLDEDSKETDEGENQPSYLREVDRADSRVLAEADKGTPFFSPDSRWLGFADDSRLRKAAVSGGTPVTVCELPYPDIRGASWGPGDVIVFGSGVEGGLWRVSANGGEPSKLTTLDLARGEESHRFPEILPDGRTVLFVVDRSGMRSFDEAEIAVLDLETGESRTLIQGGSQPRYSPSGHIVYVANGGLLAVPFDAGRAEITGAPARIFEGFATYPYFGHAELGFSPAGILAYAPGGPMGNDRRLVRVDRSGNRKPLSHAPGPYWGPKVSPDGRSIAIVVEGLSDSVWLFDLETETETRLAFEADNSYPIWSRDGRRVIFSSTRRGSRELFWQVVDSSESAVQLTSGFQNPAASSMSPDGSLLAFDAGGDIWLLSLEDSETRPFLDAPARELGPTLSPGGDLLAYLSDEAGTLDVYVTELPRGSRVKISTGGGVSPAWSPDGREIFFIGSDLQLSTVGVGRKPLRASRPQPLFSVPFRESLTERGRNYDPLPGWKRLRDGRACLGARDSAGDPRRDWVAPGVSDKHARLSLASGLVDSPTLLGPETSLGAHPGRSGPGARSEGRTVRFSSRSRRSNV